MERLKKLMVVHFFSLIQTGLFETFSALNDNWLFSRILLINNLIRYFKSIRFEKLIRITHFLIHM